MTPLDALLFLACAVVATTVQTLTGFAMGLVLLGLVGAFHVTALTDAANVASVLAIANAWIVLRGPNGMFDRQVWRDTLGGSLVGVVIGVLLLHWLSGSVVSLLRVLLGVTILGCAVLLVTRTRPLAERSSRRSFAGFGLVSGLMSGLFSSAGPPLVYQFYRQPLPLATIRQTLSAVFACNGLLRIAMTASTGQFSLHALWLSLATLPLVLCLTAWLSRHPPKLSPRMVRNMACGLLVFTGGSLVLPAVVGWVRAL